MITDKGIAIPGDMADALERDADALGAFEALRPDDQREYVDWLSKPGTQSREQRLAELGEHVRNHRHRPAPVE